MRVFVTGGSGAIGSRLVPQLIDAGHEVIGTHNSPASAERLRTLGAKPLMLDLLDPRAVRTAVLENQPGAIVHQATALANVKFSRNLDKTLAKTNELRTRGTDALLAAAREAGVRRFVAQSGAAFARYARQGGLIKTEDDPIGNPPANMQRSFAAFDHLERVVTEFGGIALRYGSSTAPRAMARSSRCASASFRSSATAAGSSLGFISRTLPRQPFSRWKPTGLPSTTSSMTSRRRCANGCRRSRRS